MKLNRWQKGLLVVLVVGVALVFGTTPASATHDPFTSVAGNGYEADQCHDFSKCGYNGPLLWNPYTIVASGIGWTTAHWDIPVLHGTRRGSELNQLDNIDAVCFNELIAGNGRVNDNIVDPIYGGPYKAPYSAWPVPEVEWIATFTPPHSADINTPCTVGPPGNCAVAVGTYPNVLFNNNGTTAVPPNPNNYGVAANSTTNSQGGALNRCDRSSYKQLMYLGYNQRQGQYQNLPMRLRAPYDRNIAGSLIWDFTNPKAFLNAHGDVRVTAANAGQSCPQAVNCADPMQSKRDSEVLSDPDAQANIDAFIDAGYSKGLGYNLYSLGLATTADGLLGQIGGHYGQSNNGFRKLNLINPETGTWFPRPHPCNRRLWESDRYGVALGFKAIADGVAGAGPGSGESLVNPPSMAMNGVASPDWPSNLCFQHDSGWDGNPNSGDPSDPSDMRYWRWYPTGNMIPNGMVMTVGGDDRDETAPACLYTDGPSCQGPPGAGNNSGSYSPGATGPWSNTTQANFNNREAGLNNSTIQVPVIDLWDPLTDTQVALENARKIYPLYPMVAARETGPGWDDWEVCTVGGESAPANQAPLPRNDNLDEAQHWRDFCSLPGCAADTRAIVSGAGGNFGAALDCLDILGAMADPNVNVPAENHWTYSTRSHNRYPYSNPMVDQTIIGTNGQTVSHKLFLLGGTHPTPVAYDPYAGTTGRLIETIELSDGNGGPAVNPTWSIWGRLIQTTSASHALALPDGNIFSSGGGGAGAANNRVNITSDDSTPAHAPVGIECGVSIGGPCTDSVSTYARAVNIKNQILCIQPASYCSLGSGQAGPQKGRVQVVGQMTVPRAGIHGVYHLLNTGEPLQSAYDRTAITRSGARMFTPGDADLAVNSSQIFTPPYLYDASVPCPTSVGCALATRPVIHKGPDYVHYGKNFELQVDNASDVKMVSMIRTGSATHTLAQDQVYVRVPFVIKKIGKAKDKKDKDKDWDKIEVTTPTKPVQAKPGDYMVFIVNNAGTPSMAKHVRLGVDQKHHGDKDYVRVFGKFDQFPGSKKDKKDKDK